MEKGGLLCSGIGGDPFFPPPQPPVMSPPAGDWGLHARDMFWRAEVVGEPGCCTKEGVVKGLNGRWGWEGWG